MKEKIMEIANDTIKDDNLWVDEVIFSGGKLTISLDSDTSIDLNRIVDASKKISKVLDEKDLIKNNYMLDISSKEKKENEQ